MRGSAYPPYIPVAEVPLEAPRNEGGTREKLAFLQGLYAQHSEPIDEGMFQQACTMLFRIQVPRGAAGGVDLVDPALADYLLWEAEATRRARTLPLKLSEAVYNFARPQQYTHAGRLGLPIPQEEKRAIYATNACHFLSFCKDRGEAWALNADIPTCWVRFLQTPTVAEETSRLDSVGEFILSKAEGKAFAKLTSEGAILGLPWLKGFLNGLCFNLRLAVACELDEHGGGLANAALIELVQELEPRNSSQIFQVLIKHAKLVKVRVPIY